MIDEVDDKYALLRISSTVETTLEPRLDPEITEAEDRFILILSATVTPSGNPFLANLILGTNISARTPVSVRNITPAITM
ncbi:hypothetical protein ACHAWT_008477 [Skeletonema menzelii]